MSIPKLFCTLVVFFITHICIAQTKKITGKVSSSTKIPVSGVTIQVKGSTTFTTTDEAGNFSITAPASERTILVFSSVGFEKKEMPVLNGSAVDVELKEEAQGLNDVVVVGYGSLKKTDLTGSVTSLKSDKLMEMPVVSVEQALSGRMAGVQVQQTSGQPGAGISIRVRGVSSIAGGNEPLYVIDGLPQFNDDVRGANGLATINPADIESIEVLKDAAATAIYGSRGANGVVMVTTKSGKTGEPRVTIESSIGLQQVRKKLELMNSTEYVDFAKRYYTNSAQPVPPELDTFVLRANTDWQDEVFRPAILFNSNLSISGGTDRTRYFVSTGFIDQQGIVENSSYKRASLRVNLDSKVSDHFSIQTRLIFSRALQNGFSPSQGDNTRNFGKSGIGSVLRSISTVGIKNPDGTYTDTSPFSFNGIDVENPVAIAREALDQNTTTRVQGGLDLKTVLVKGLTNTTRISADFYHIRRDLYFPKILATPGK